MDYSPPTPLSMAFSRQEYWSGLPFPSPGDLPDPGIEPTSPALQADSLLSETCKSQLSFSRNILPVFLCILFMSVVAQRFQSLTLSETDQVSKFWHPLGKQLLWSFLISFNHNFLMGLKNPNFKEKCPPLSVQRVPCDPSENHCLWFCYLSFPSFLSFFINAKSAMDEGLSIASSLFFTAFFSFKVNSCVLKYCIMIFCPLH